ncbi:MAG: hypothetical protein M0Z79_02930 [Nitrospiraceae bacterium]|nr:hypothetical protein [Nitrospiraceae bacterium]
MDDRRKVKRFLVAGAIVGAIISLVISLLMDTLFQGTPQGTWRDAIAKDLNTFFSLGVSSGSVVVTFVFIVVLGILSTFGAFMGFIFSFFLYRFFSFLGSK